MRLTFILLTLIYTCVGKVFGQEAFLSSFEEQAEKLFQQSEATGAAISIVSGEEVLQRFNFGYANAKKKQPFDEKTLYPLSSNTKAFTGALTTLVCDGLSIDPYSSLHSLCPDIQFSDDYLQNNIHAVDVLSHRWGFPRIDLIYETIRTEDRRAANKLIVERIADMKPYGHFRQDWQYGNNQYVLMAYVLEHLTHQTWESLLQDSILTPLDMQRTLTEYDDYLKHTHRSVGYNKGESFEPFPSLYHVSGMGNMFSCLEDMEKWCQAQLNSSILNQEQLDFCHFGHTKIGFPPPHAGMSSWDYGLGWASFSYYGEPVILHHGDNIGHCTVVAIMPNQDVAWTIVVNEFSSPLLWWWSYTLMDAILERPQQNWTILEPVLEYDYHLYQPTTAQIPSDFNEKKLVGSYAHPTYGQLDIIYKKKQLYIHFASIDIKLQVFAVNENKVSVYGDYPPLEYDFLLEFELLDDKPLAFRSNLGAPFLIDLEWLEFERIDE